jgi:hypothetical protein
MDIDVLWENIIKHADEKFYTSKGIEFTYSLLNANTIMPMNVNGSRLRPISKNSIEKVITEQKLPLQFTTQVQQYQAPSYVYAILTDKRIC